MEAAAGSPRLPRGSPASPDAPCMTPRGPCVPRSAAEQRGGPARRDVVLARQPGLGPGPVARPGGRQPRVAHGPAVQLHEGHDHGGRGGGAGYEPGRGGLGREKAMSAGGVRPPRRRGIPVVSGGHAPASSPPGFRGGGRKGGRPGAEFVSRWLLPRPPRWLLRVRGLIWRPPNLTGAGSKMKPAIPSCPLRLCSVFYLVLVCFGAPIQWCSGDSGLCTRGTPPTPSPSPGGAPRTIWDARDRSRDGPASRRPLRCAVARAFRPIRLLGHC